MFIPPIKSVEDNREIGYKVLWQEKSTKKNIDMNELDDSEIKEIEEFEIDVVKGTDNLSDLFTNAKEVIQFFDNVSVDKCEWKKIISFYINKDNTIERKSEESYYTLKERY